MAVFLRVCWSQKDTITTELIARTSEAEEHRFAEYNAAVLIQSWWRGILVRNHMRFLHDQATNIQRHWRGYCERQAHISRVREALQKMCEAHFHQSAVMIQKTWRGYYTRRHVANYYTRKEYLEGVHTQNILLRGKIDEVVAERRRLAEKRLRQQKEEEFIELAKRHHFMASTAVADGVYQGRLQTGRDALLEETMRSLKPHLKPSEEWHRHLQEHYAKTNARPTIETACDGELSSVLPPIREKVQGPFRAPAEVLAQRHRPLNPTLRVATSTTSAQDARLASAKKEWCKRIHDKQIQPFSKVSHPTVSLIHTQSSYKKPPYGTVHFREEFPRTEHYSGKTFDLRTRPIALFDQNNKLYTA